MYIIGRKRKRKREREMDVRLSLYCIYIYVYVYLSLLAIKQTRQQLADTVDKLVLKSPHDISVRKDRYSCGRCQDSFSKKDPMLKAWLSSACVHAGNIVCNRPTPILNEFMHVGNQTIHFTHRMTVHKGFVYCRKCGCKRGTNQVRKLAKPYGPPGKYGLQTLRAIHFHDKLPPGMAEWPDGGA